MTISYALPRKSKANKEVEAAVTNAVAQVQGTSLSMQDKLEYSYLIVREKLDRMEMSNQYDYACGGVSDTEVCEAVMTELGIRLGATTVYLMKEYPENLVDLSALGLSLVA